MKNSRKITYSAVCTALAVILIILSRFSPLKITPLLALSFCFFIALRCGFIYGLLVIAATFLITVWWGIDLSILLSLIMFAPYSIAAFFIKALNYKSKKNALLRGGVVVVIFNIAFALIFFVFADLVGKLFFGVSVADIGERIGGVNKAYIILALIGTVLAIGFDIMFVMADDTITTRLKIPK